MGTSALGRKLYFWATVPLSLKKNQLLYKKMLSKNNWADVWADIPLNKKNIRPAWILPVRNVLKIGFAPFGRQKWHNFEKRYLSYFTDLVGNYAIYPYSYIATSEKIGRNSVSWHTNHYLTQSVRCALNNNAASSVHSKMSEEH